MLLGLRTLIFSAPDLVAARDWYTQVLGQAAYFDEPYYVGFAVGGFELGLVPEGAPSVLGARAYWGVESVDAALVRLNSLGATTCEAANDVGEGIRVASVRDPFGNLLGVIENPNFDPASVR